MRLKYLIISLFCLVSCDIEQNSPIKSSSHSTSLLIPTLNPSPSTTPIPDITPSPESEYSKQSKIYAHLLDSDGNYCQPFEQADMKARIRFPLDISVKRDGSAVYVLNEDCKLSETDKLPTSYKNCQEININKKIILTYRKFIYKIDQDKKINLLKVNNEYPISCTLDKEIETDDNDNIYITEPSKNRLYKISSNEDKLEKIAEIRERSPRGNTDAALDINGIPLIPYLYGPENLYVYNNEPYFTLVNTRTNGDGYIKKLTNDGKIQTIYSRGNSLGYFNFVINKDYLFFEFGGYSLLEPDKNYLIRKYPENFVVYKSEINSKGEIFFCDINNNIIWKVIPFESKELIKFAGSGKAGFKDGVGTEAEFNSPHGIDIDKYDNLYITDTNNHAVRKITPDGVVTTFYKQEF